MPGSLSPILTGKETQSCRRLHIVIKGAVQGVGFRPFIYRLACDMQLNGWVNNSSDGVVVEAEGSQRQLEDFIRRIKEDLPKRAKIKALESSFLDYAGYSSFVIRESRPSETKTAYILPDIATCPDCLTEIFDPQNRRYLYPFTNCTNCGPRFSIVKSIPYDRANTTMKKFKMCGACAAEYQDPANRRFHAQPNACPQCGPHLQLWDKKGKKIASHHQALLKALAALRLGKIIALKGLGGFQFIVDAQNEKAVARLRARKRREEKPFALMFPDLESIKQHCHVSKMEEALLASPEAPIVLLRRATASKDALAPSLAPHNPYLGAMLPYTPLHHIFMKQINIPVVATSGNLSDEPICTDEKEALARLSEIADVFLVHNRPIARHMDDSVVRVVAERLSVLRLARGFAPFTIHVEGVKPGILATGAHLKNTVALSVGGDVFISQHLGDLETAQSLNAFRQSVKDLPQLYESRIKKIACDMHADYLSTKYAKSTKLPVVAVQHHHAHMASCMAENNITQSVFGVSWDGTGFGSDGTVWGGEFLAADFSSFRRLGHLKTFRLAGGEIAIREPRRAALGVLFEIFGKDVLNMRDIPSLNAFTKKELTLLTAMLSKNVRAPVTSSAGRLFDAVASLVGLHQKVSFEGQAAMGLEYLLGKTPSNESYPFDISPSPVYAVDWTAMIRAIVSDVRAEKSKSEISEKFHNTLVEMIIAAAKRQDGAPQVLADCPCGVESRRFPIPGLQPGVLMGRREKKDVALSGGCFQNKYLTERVIDRLRQEGFNPLWHSRIPPNDGGISLGQVVAAAARGITKHQGTITKQSSIINSQ